MHNLQINLHFYSFTSSFAQSRSKCLLLFRNRLFEMSVRLSLDIRDTQTRFYHVYLRVCANMYVHLQCWLVCMCKYVCTYVVLTGMYVQTCTYVVLTGMYVQTCTYVILAGMYVQTCTYVILTGVHVQICMHAPHWKMTNIQHSKFVFDNHLINRLSDDSFANIWFQVKRKKWVVLIVGSWQSGCYSKHTFHDLWNVPNWQLSPPLNGKVARFFLVQRVKYTKLL
jgi:hypothetical protein